MPKRDEANSKIRVSLDLNEPVHRRLSELEHLTQADSKAGVIRQALQVYEYVARKSMEGYKFKSVGPNGVEENLVFFNPYAPAGDETAAQLTAGHGK